MKIIYAKLNQQIENVYEENKLDESQQKKFEETLDAVLKCHEDSDSFQNKYNTEFVAKNIEGYQFHTYGSTVN